MADITLDDVLDLENEFYKEGFTEGQEKSVRDNFLEGKAYGLQTGFQRFLVLGYIQGLVESWEQYQSKAVQGHLSQLKDIIKDIPLTNGDKEVAKYELAIGKARNKVRVLASITKSSEKIAKLDNLIKEVGGALQVSENVDEMW
ncbi:hypothetical protein ACI3LY_001611 [Candidozyma auris]|uniref:Essential protein Yae1 N-terminal domain-containing protein n=1 Tax=Candidozyma auris TaxID=498019 RepID=A0A2H0ZPX9_CANAR|nr:ribosome biosynthesis protein LTO1 [[Candida] auris]PIS52701.1 hypothetical protein CJI97_002352 [[Candida] auris]PIS55586.1 hypothetical protein B9J08_001690 [[Candida] auris]PSK79953.1 hypothetical protein CJJ07_000014 [[Candida] auris]QEL59704.1 hypothetical protein CJJ09_001786 [[Candida] auris]QEO19381.1 hypothetical_protein [[Candida] auris]